MSLRFPRWPAGCCVALLLAVSAHAAPQPGDCMDTSWAKLLWPKRTQVRFEPTTLEERRAFRAIIPPLLHAARRGAALPHALQERARGVGFSLEEWRRQGERLWILRELPGQWRGAGAYVLRVGLASDDIIQAPHADHDLGTGDLGVAVFSCGEPGRRPRAFATNTAHRHEGAGRGLGAERLNGPADVAHNPAHLFQVVTELWLSGMDRPRLVQVHGFTHRNRPERARVTAVVSAGSREVSDWARQVRGRLPELLDGGVRLFPEETELLGGTTNVQARLAHGHPAARFLHLELSPEARRALAQPEQARKLSEALLAPEEP